MSSNHSNTQFNQIITDFDQSAYLSYLENNVNRKGHRGSIATYLDPIHPDITKLLNVPSCAGVIPFTSDMTRVVLVKNQNGAVSFPKGKIEKGQKKNNRKADANIFEAGLRELREETGLGFDQININSDLYVDEPSMSGKPGAIRLFLATLKNDNPILLPEDVDEISEAKLYSISEAMSVLMPKRQKVLMEALSVFKTITN